MVTLPIEPIFNTYIESLASEFQGTEIGTTEENLQARIRGNLLMAASNKFNWIVLTTGNKSEMATGYATLYGDMAGGFAVIKDVSKTLVKNISIHLIKKEISQTTSWLLQTTKTIKVLSELEMKMM